MTFGFVNNPDKNLSAKIQDYGETSGLDFCMTYFRHILACNNFHADTFLPFEIAGRTVAWVRPEFALKLAEYSSVFRLEASRIGFNDSLCDFQQRSQAVAAVSQDMLQNGTVSRLHGELYPVTTG